MRSLAATKGEASMKEWDVFISHASEDKQTVALPLAAALRGHNFRVWIDSQELRLGASLRESIDEGLARSRYGVVIISPAFLGKDWPRRELNGLFALEDGAYKRILPIWHQVDKPTVAKHSPILADRIAAKWKDGVADVAAQVAAAVNERLDRRILGGWIRFHEGLAEDHPLNQMQSAISGGRLTRTAPGQLAATLVTSAPVVEYQKFAERLGFASLDMTSSDNDLSADPAAPTRFRGTQRVHVRRGETLLNIMTWSDVVVPIDMTLDVVTSADGALSGDKFAGKFLAEYRVLPVNQYFKMAGTFEVVLE
jgi:hypothetical protein